MLWEVEIRPSAHQIDREGLRVVHEAQDLRATTIQQVQTARSFLLQGNALTIERVTRAAETLLVDPIVETFQIRCISGNPAPASGLEHSDAS